MGKENDLLEAARSGNIALVEKILNPKSKSKWPPSIQTLGFLKGPNVSCQDQNGETPLHFAALNNHKEIVELLLKYQASANIPDLKGCYPLHLAAWRGNLEICQILLTNGPSVAIINSQNLDGDTALHSAAQYGHTEVANLLLQKCANPLIKNAKGEKALDLAVMFGRQETVEMLLNSPDSRIYLSITRQDKSPLHLAAKSGNVNVVRMLLASGFDVNHLNESGTALHEAALHGKLEVFKLLLSQGGDVLLTNSDNKTTIDLLNDLNNPVSSDMKKLILDFDNEKMKAAQKNIDNAKFNSITEDYDIIPKVTGKHQGIDSISHLSRNSVGSSTSSVFQAGGMAEEESIYDCPQAGARALYPPGVAKTNLASTSFNKIDRPNTPKKPPRKKITNSSSKGSEKQPASDANSGCPQNSLSGGCLSDRTEGSASNYTTPVGSFNSGKTSCGSTAKLPTPPSHPPVSRPLMVVCSESSMTAIISGSSPRPTQRQFMSTSPSAQTSGSSSQNNSTSSPHHQSYISGARPGNLVMNTTGIDPFHEPPTPDHPPPSPETALLDIQHLINSERRKSRDIHTSTENDDMKVPPECVPVSSRRETFPDFGRNSPLKELNNNDSIFHGLTLGSSPLSTMSPTRKSSRMMRFNNLINSRTLPSFMPSPLVSTSTNDDNVTNTTGLQKSGKANKDPVSYSHLTTVGDSLKTNSQIVTDVDKAVEGKEDWNQMENLFKAPFTDGFEILINEFDKRMTSILSEQTGTSSMLSVTDWLESINLPHYENILIVNGFDDMQFMGLLDSNDMEEMGIKNEEHRMILSNNCKMLTPPPEPCYDSIKGWLESLRILEYYDMFNSQGCHDIGQVFEFTDSQLQNMFKYMLLGHRKRLKSSLQRYCSKFQKIKKTESDACTVGNHLSETGCLHRPESLITGCCNYTVHYLGSMEVSISDGSDPPKLAIAKMKDSLTCIDEMPTVTLSISYLGVRFIDLKNKAVICSHDISNIFSASQGEDCLNYFAYITQSMDDGPFLCHVFHARSEELAREIMMVLGEAFYVAYQLAIRDQIPSKEVQGDFNRLASKETCSRSIISTIPVSSGTEIVPGPCREQKHLQSRSTEI